MSPFKLPFKKVRAPCCGPRSKTNSTAEQEGAHGVPAEKKTVKVGLSANFSLRRSKRAGNAKINSTTYVGASCNSVPSYAATCDSSASTCGSTISADSVCSTASFTLRQYCDSTASLASFHSDATQQDTRERTLSDEDGSPLSPMSSITQAPAASTCNVFVSEEEEPAFESSELIDWGGSLVSLEGEVSEILPILAQADDGAKSQTNARHCNRSSEHSLAEDNCRAIEDSFVLRSTLTLLATRSLAWSIAQEYDQLDQTAAAELKDEDYDTKELEASVAQFQRDIVEKERYLQALEKQEKWEMFCRSKQQAHAGDCFAIVYCAIFRLRAIALRQS